MFYQTLNEAALRKALGTEVLKAVGGRFGRGSGEVCFGERRDREKGMAIFQ